VATVRRQQSRVTTMHGWRVVMGAAQPLARGGSSGHQAQRTTSHVTVPSPRWPMMTNMMPTATRPCFGLIAISGSFKARVSAGRESTSVGESARGRRVLIAAIL
jgi:hypothetical protein